ncbi:roadblock/LC7 domain-containing protein [Streptomyces sp. NPDC020707]|uniref:roadblock/LC7 domain-containing protein n=1 Tax=Streptomyces sp. NPDC020707 TaxID=3365084 RepID=UPI0037B2A1CD
MTLSHKIRPDLGPFLDELVKMPDGRFAVLLSADGLMTACSAGVPRDEADRIAAMASGIQSLSQQGGVFVNPGGSSWHQTMVSYKDGYLFIIAAAEGAILIAAAGANVDVGNFGHQMILLVRRLGESGTVEPRNSPTDRA